MLGKIKKIMRSLVPGFIISWYHFGLAILAKIISGNPSQKLRVIGVTGTNGKSTTVNLIGKILESAGHKVGWTTTINFKIGEKEWLNNKKMTMLGRMALQNLLKRMVREKCNYAVIETSSEGIKQFRHLGLNYDVAVFTNLTPEHIESHGSFENYKKAKGKLFSHTAKSKKKKIDGKLQEKVSVINIDDEHAEYFASFKLDKKYGFSTRNEKMKDINGIAKANNIKISLEGSTFEIEDVQFTTKLVGEFNVYNCLSAIATAKTLGVSLEKCAKAIAQIPGVPGRMESIDEGQKFRVLVDYAPEVKSMEELYKFINKHAGVKGKKIHVLGSCGGGRDKSRRPILGGMAGKNADVVIVTNEDPYDENPRQIIAEVVAGAMGDDFEFPMNDFGGELKFITKKGKEIIAILDRKKAIERAIEIAEDDDIVMITGKGSEQAMCVANGKKIPWDDREVVRKKLKDLVS